jgi:predicted dehydrogenase
VTFLKECLSRPNIRHLLLEKPLAPSPHLGSTLLKRLIDSRKAFRIGYIFRHTKWGMPLLAALREDRLAGQLTIRWTFLAHHFGQDLASWKRYSDDGGGAIRFYGIHLISLLADCGYSDVVLSQALGPSPNECEKWRAVFAGPHLPRCEVLIDTRSDDRAFHVELDSGAGAKTFAALSDPFDSDPRSASDDRRVSALRKLCRSIRDDRNDYADYEATNDLWGIVEDRTQFVHA